MQMRIDEISENLEEVSKIGSKHEHLSKNFEDNIIRISSLQAELQTLKLKVNEKSTSQYHQSAEIAAKINVLGQDLKDELQANVMHDIHRNTAEISEMKSDIQEIKDRIDMYNISTKSFSKVVSEANSLKKQFNELSNAITVQPQNTELISLTSQIQQAEQRISSLSKQVEEVRKPDSIQARSTSNTMPSQVEPMVAEMVERENRKRNLLIFGLIESESKKPEERKRDDLEAVKSAILTIHEAFILENVKIFRLGPYQAGRLRPVKVVFPTKAEAGKVLKKKNEVPKNSGWYIKYDQTSMERAYLKQLISELEQRKIEGENIEIRYINNIPKIIKSKDHVRIEHNRSQNISSSKN